MSGSTAPAPPLQRPAPSPTPRPVVRRPVQHRPPGLHALAAMVWALWLAAGCSTPERPPAKPPVAAADAPPPPPAAAPLSRWPGAQGQVAGRHEGVLVYVAAEGDTAAGIAARFLQSPALAWQVAEANGQRWQLAAGQPVVVPLVHDNPLGVGPDGVQTVPVLCYHRFGSTPSKMVVTPTQFEAQLDWLAREHYQVIRPAELAEFLAGQRALPQRSVLITIDDGYESAYRHALPALRKHGFPATLFVYTDFIGARDGLVWAQLEELARSGLVELQAHSKSHRNLARPAAGESDASYLQALDAEVRQPRSVLERRLGNAGVQVRHFAYPYGDANDAVLKTLQQQHYELAFTVQAGGNAFFAHPLLLRRTMIFGDLDLEEFKARVQTRRGPGR